MAIKSVAAIIENSEGKILLIKRANTHSFEGFWALPGGKIDAGETAEAAVVKEVKEETNLSFTPKDILGEYKESFPQYSWDSYAFVFMGSFSGNVRGNEESTNIGWFSKEEINGMKLAFSHNKVLQDYFSQKTIS